MILFKKHSNNFESQVHGFWLNIFIVHKTIKKKQEEEFNVTDTLKIDL